MAFSLLRGLIRIVFSGYGCVLTYFFLGFPYRRPSFPLTKLPERLFMVL